MGALDFKLYHGLSRGLFLSLFIRADDVNDDMTVGTFQHYRTNTYHRVYRRMIDSHHGEEVYTCIIGWTT